MFRIVLLKPLFLVVVSSTFCSRMFSLHRSPQEQLRAFQALNSDESKLIFKQGEELVQLCSSGSFLKLRQTLAKVDIDSIFTFFVADMFLKSLVNGHLIISKYIIDNGYPFSSPLVPNSIYDAINTVDDSRAVEILAFICRDRYDVNEQVN